MQFDSPDHVALISSYKVEVWLVGVDPATGAPIATSTLAKDKVTATGLAAPEPQYQANLADVTPVFAVPAGQPYVLRMMAVGLDGVLTSVRSTPTGPFVIAGVPASLTNVRIR